MLDTGLNIKLHIVICKFIGITLCVYKAALYFQFYPDSVVYSLAFLLHIQEVLVWRVTGIVVPVNTVIHLGAHHIHFFHVFPSSYEMFLWMVLINNVHL